MAKKEKNDYFEMFTGMTEYCCAAGRNLLQTLSAFELQNLPQLMDVLHKIEHSGDEAKHAMMKKLVKEFITPIEREDIIRLGNEIDNVTDSIEDVLLKIYMYNISSIRPDAIRFAEVIVQCCDELKLIMQEFHNYKKSTSIYDSIIELNHLEEVGDALYIEAVHNLYVQEKDAIQVLAWTEVYDRLERCCDECEHVANVVESVIMKNS